MLLPRLVLSMQSLFKKITSFKTLNANCYKYVNSNIHTVIYIICNIDIVTVVVKKDVTIHLHLTAWYS